MKLDIYSTINYCSSISSIVPFVVLILKGKWVWKYNIGIFLYVLYNLLTEFLSVLMASFHVRSLEAKIAIDAIEGTLLLSAYYLSFKEIWIKKITAVVGVIFLIGYISIYFLWDRYLYVPSHVFAFQHLMMLIPLILYFGERLRLMDDEYLTDNPMFWITSGFLIFYSVSIFYFAFFNELFFHYKEVFIKGWAIHSLALIIMNILLAKGLWLIPKDSKSL